MCSLLSWLLVFGTLWLIQIDLLAAFYQCGIRKHAFVQLVHRGWKVDEGQWPWHVAIFHREQEDATRGSQYACGGSLLDSKHVLTAAHCVVHSETGYPLPASSIELHFGQLNLSKLNNHVQVRDVSMVHVHPEHSTHRNDIAVMVMRLPVEYTDFVVPICLDQRADKDLRNLVGQRGWITGWGTTENGVIADALRTASLPVVNYLQCFNDDETLFGNVLNSKVFCAGDRNGTSPGTGDSGGGMYFSEGDRWVLRGIISFAKFDELLQEVDTSKYVVFVNVQQYLTWIKDIVDEDISHIADRPKRISETECDKFKSLAQKRSNGICSNSRYPHTVSILDNAGEPLCTGILVNENHVLTACHCIRYAFNKTISKIQIDAYGTVDALETLCHPMYRVKYAYHDLAVVKLKNSVDLSSFLIPACLASNWTENLQRSDAMDNRLETRVLVRNTAEHQVLSVYLQAYMAAASLRVSGAPRLKNAALLQTGYGVSSLGVKKFVESDDNQVITKSECDPLIKGARRLANGIIPAQLCVSNTDRLRTSVQGSSGGPLQSVNSRTCMYTVVGVTSTGNAVFGDVLETNHSVLTIYTRVAYYLDWIEQVVWNVDPSMTTTVSPQDLATSDRNWEIVIPED